LIHTLTVCQNGKFRTDLQLSEISDVLAEPDNIVWLDVCDPTEQDVALLQEEFRFHPLAIEDAVRSHERPKVDAYDRYYFIVFYAAFFDPNNDHIDLRPLSLFVGANYLVSVHPGEVQQIGFTLARWQMPNSPLINRLSALLHAVLDAVVDDYFPLMDQVADRIEELEDAIFAHFDESSIHTIFGLKKDLLSLRRVVAPERDVLNMLLRRELPVFTPEDTMYLQDVYDHIVRVTDNIDTYRDLLSSALDSYLSLQSNKLNEIMKILTIASIILMSNSLVAGTYGMNFQFMPELHWTFGYPFALGLMIVIDVMLILYFRHRKWL
jgi:magnesium transporter